MALFNNFNRATFFAISWFAMELLKVVPSHKTSMPETVVQVRTTRWARVSNHQFTNLCSSQILQWSGPNFILSQVNCYASLSWPALISVLASWRAHVDERTKVLNRITDENWTGHVKLRFIWYRHASCTFVSDLMEMGYADDFSRKSASCLNARGSGEKLKNVNSQIVPLLGWKKMDFGHSTKQVVTVSMYLKNRVPPPECWPICSFFVSTWSSSLIKITASFDWAI